MNLTIDLGLARHNQSIIRRVTELFEGYLIVQVGTTPKNVYHSDPEGTHGTPLLALNMSSKRIDAVLVHPLLTAPLHFQTDTNFEYIISASSADATALNWHPWYNSLFECIDIPSEVVPETEEAENQSVINFANIVTKQLPHFTRLDEELSERAIASVTSPRIEVIYTN